jgi:glycosyltransferase involved in cell wall biosynthesis
MIRSLFYKKIPLIGDLHENYVEGLKHYRFANSFPGNILISIKKWEKAEIRWSLKMDHILTVIEEASKRYESLGIPKEKIHIVSNYVDSGEFLSQNENPEIMTKFDNKFTLVYTGAFDLHRGLEIAVRSLPEAIKKGFDIYLVLVGSGKNTQDLMNLANNLHVIKNVFFEGWQKRENLFSYIKSSDICIVPHIKTVHTDNTIPHKLFQYMLLKKPVIVSDCDPLVRIVKESGCGLVYRSNKPDELAECLNTLYLNRSMRENMGKMGYNAVMEKYNWEIGQKSLVKLYRDIADNQIKV